MCRIESDGVLALVSFSGGPEVGAPPSIPARQGRDFETHVSTKYGSMAETRKISCGWWHEVWSRPGR